MTLGWIVAASVAGGTLSAGAAAFALLLRASWVPMLVSFARQALHAAELELVHPRTRKPMTWRAPLPADMAALLERLRHGV